MHCFQLLRARLLKSRGETKLDLGELSGARLDLEASITILSGLETDERISMLMLECYYDLARYYHLAGQLDTASDQLVTCIRIGMRCHGGDDGHTCFGRIYNYLAILAQESGKYDQAQFYFKKSLRNFEASPGDLGQTYLASVSQNLDSYYQEAIGQDQDATYLDCKANSSTCISSNSNLNENIPSTTSGGI